MYVTEIIQYRSTYNTQAGQSGSACYMPENKNRAQSAQTLPLKADIQPAVPGSINGLK